jgi:hypothetical protein
MADIPETEDSYHPFVLVDDRQPANVQLFHVPHRLGEVIVITATMDFCLRRVTSGSWEGAADRPTRKADL